MMLGLFSVCALSLLSGCATIVKSDKIPVHFVGGVPQGETQISLPDGEFTTKTGDRVIMVTRSKEDIPISVTCNNETQQGYIITKFDTVAGVLGNIVIGGLIGMGIDAYNNKAYDPPETFNLKPLCSIPASQLPVAETGADDRKPRNPSSLVNFQN